MAGYITIYIILYMNSSNKFVTIYAVKIMAGYIHIYIILYMNSTNKFVTIYAVKIMASIYKNTHDNTNRYRHITCHHICCQNYDMLSK